MARYSTSWVESPEIRPQDSDKTCKQVYVWLVTEDRQTVIVSKDGITWQLPGGKPESDETFQATAVREVREETSLDISQEADRLRFIGYQTVQELETDNPAYLQVRYLLNYPARADDLRLGAHYEDTEQPAADTIRFAGAVSLDEIAERIPWLSESPELNTVRALVPSPSLG